MLRYVVLQRTRNSFGALDDFAACCPHGWIEVHRGDEGSPPEILRVWGVPPEHAASLIDPRALERSGPFFAGLHLDSTSILKVTNLELDDPLMINKFSIAARWAGQAEGYGSPDVTPWIHGRGARYFR